MVGFLADKGLLIVNFMYNKQQIPYNLIKATAYISKFRKSA